ncbi:MAG: hypothetical protein K0B08_04255 [Bacteroidales bacterium]|nr:hypothetical protein [Bacteroidales bacterium]
MIKDIIARMNSYLGLIQHRDTHRLREKYGRRFSEGKAKAYFCVNESYTKLKTRRRNIFS